MSEGIEVSSIIDPSDPIVGKLFPVWMVNAFQDLILGKESFKEGEDPCRRSADNAQVLRPYQKLLSRYLSLPPFRGLLVYHGLGSGKTAGAIHLIGVLNRDDDYNIVVLLPAALQQNWLDEMKLWLPDSYEKYSIRFVSTNASNLEKQFFDVIKSIDTNKKTLYMIDEAHNFISNVYSNQIQGKQRAMAVYNHIQNDMMNTPGTRVVLLSGTPIRSDVFEVSLLFNLLRPGSLPKSEATFQNLFLYSSGEEDVPRLNPKRKHLFQRRIAGLVSFFRGSSPLLYAKRETISVNLVMEGRQEDVYTYFKTIERKAEALAISKRGKSTQSFKTTTRLCSNFVSPVKGIKRPRPAQYRLNHREDDRLMSGKDVKDDINSSVKQYLDDCNAFMKEAEEYLKTIDKQNPGALQRDIQKWVQQPNDFERFRRSEGLSQTFMELLYCSVKITAALFLASSSPGSVLIYSNFVIMEGLEAVKMYLRIGGISFVEFHGGVDKGIRIENLKKFNAGQAKVMLLSSAGSEGISLKNVRTVIILEPAWSEDTVQQVIGRAIRQCSHKDLPMSDRKVQIFRLKALESSPNSRSTDEHVEDQAFKKNAQKQSFLDAIKEASIDCDLFSKQNMVGDCFRFPSSETLQQTPGPVYQKDILVDIEKDDAYRVTRIRVKKIKGDVNGKVGDYLLDEKSGVVYDAEFHHPVGKVYADEKGFFEKSSTEVYVISDHVYSKMKN